MEEIFLKNRLVCPSKLRKFSHDKRLELVVRRKCALTRHVTSILLNAYREFIELKIITRDYATNRIMPSHPVRFVWRLHILDTRLYDAACKELCGKLIKYDPGCGGDQGEAVKYTRDVYAHRYNRVMQGAVWGYVENPAWWKDYATVDTQQKVKCLRFSVEHKKVKGTSENNAANKKANNAANTRPSRLEMLVKKDKDKRRNVRPRLLLEPVDQRAVSIGQQGGGHHSSGDHSGQVLGQAEPGGTSSGRVLREEKKKSSVVTRSMMRKRKLAQNGDM